MTDSIITCDAHPRIETFCLVDEHVNGTYMTSVLRLVGVNNGAGHDYEGVLRRELWICFRPFIVFKCCPCSTIFDLHYSRFRVAGAFRKQCHCISMTKCVNGTTEEGLAIFVLAVHRNISRAVENFAQHGIRKETGCTGRSACHRCHLKRENYNLCSNSVVFCGEEKPRLCDIN